MLLRSVVPEEDYSDVISLIYHYGFLRNGHKCKT